MRVRFLGVLLAGLLLASTAACQSGQPGAGGAPSPNRSPSHAEPTPGGPTPSPATPPSAPMDDLEQAVASRLNRQMAHEGLDLQYVACPAWHGRAPSRLTCRGYIDGVTAGIRVRLSRLTGGAVSFKAQLRDGVIATAELERKLRSDGFRDVNCGNVRAYPSVVGSKVTCAVTKDGHRQFVVATVTSRSGAVEIRGS